MSVRGPLLEDEGEEGDAGNGGVRRGSVTEGKAAGLLLSRHGRNAVAPRHVRLPFHHVSVREGGREGCVCGGG